MRADSIAALGNPVVRDAEPRRPRRSRVRDDERLLPRRELGRRLHPEPEHAAERQRLLPLEGLHAAGMPNARKGLLAPGDGPNFPLTMKDAGYLTYHHGKRGNTAPLDPGEVRGQQVPQERRGGAAERRAGQGDRGRGDRLPEGEAGPAAGLHVPRLRQPARPAGRRQEVPRPVRPGEDPAAEELPARPPVRQRRTGRPRRATPAVAADRRPTSAAPCTSTTPPSPPSTITSAGCSRTLEDAGQLDNTLVIFSADQGIAVGSHGLLGKQNLYDHSMKAPLVFAGPGIPRGRSDALVYLFDIFPTVCDLVGAKVPEEIDGRSFRPVLDGKATTARPELMLAYRGQAAGDPRRPVEADPLPGGQRHAAVRPESRPGRDEDLADDPAQQDRVADLLRPARQAPGALRRRPAADRREPPTRRAGDPRTTPVAGEAYGPEVDSNPSPMTECGEGRAVGSRRRGCWRGRCARRQRSFLRLRSSHGVDRPPG